MNPTRRAWPRGHACVALVLLLVGAAPARSATVTLSVPRLEAATGTEVEVPILVKGAKGMSALQARLTYDPAVLEVVKDAADPDKAVTKGKILPDNAIFKVYTTTIPVHNGDAVPVKPGGLPIVFVGGTNKEKKEYFAVQEDGTLATIRFRVIGQGGQTTPLALDRVQAFQSNDMDMIVKTEPGEVSVRAAIPWLWIAVGAGALLLLLLLLAVGRRKQQPQAPLAYAGAAPQGAGVPVFQPEGATFQYQCTKCGGTLKLPVLLAGKQVQCSACGTTQVAVP